MKVSVTMATSWHRAKEMALQTIGKSLKNEPDAEWERKMLLCEHAPIRMVEYDIKVEGVPYWVVMHLVRHHIGFEKFVTTQRDDRAHNDIPREEKPQGALVDVTFVANAQALINISKVRLCSCASKETRELWSLIKDKVFSIDPIMASFMQPSCVYRGFCPEIKSCGFCNTKAFTMNRDLYINVTKNQ